MRYLLAVLLYSGLALCQCKVEFSVVMKDELNNSTQGFDKKTLDWYQKKMVKKYPDVCYKAGAPPVVFYVSDKPAIYHGTKTVRNAGTITEDGQKSADISINQQVPEEVEYRKIYLSIETGNAQGGWDVAHNFQGKSLHPTMYGICTHNCHPEQELFESAIKWIHDGGLNDPKQSMLQ